MYWVACQFSRPTTKLSFPRRLTSVVFTTTELSTSTHSTFLSYTLSPSSNLLFTTHQLRSSVQTFIAVVML
ncbi:hypothetical protein PM082_020692 [Marasmius tenuissimus]|nr:hypothetical protein PM082_020692 [Marasmius tenuissimus]